MNLHFERLKENDIHQLQNIIEEEAFDGYDEYDFAQAKTFLSEKQNIAIAAKLNDKIIGLIYGYSLTRFDGKAPQFFIYAVDIHKDYQNKGYGSRFVKYVVGWARDNGFCESFVLTDKDNLRACRVYEKAGMKHSEKDCERMYVAEYGGK
jgi:GNAT superfamily N-acetyltransferase